MTDRVHQIHRKTVAMQVTEQLRAMILSGELASGEKLRQERLASLLGVSRVPVREALNQLEAEGLISVETHKGAVVSGLSFDELLEMYELRAVLEPWLLELAMARLTPNDLKSARAILDEMLSQKTQKQHWSGMNWTFHKTLYTPSGRKQSLELLERLYMNIYRHFQVSLRFTIGLEAMDKEHRHLLELIGNHDTEEAKAFLKDHIMRGCELLVERMQSNQTPPPEPAFP